MAETIMTKSVVPPPKDDKVGIGQHGQWELQLYEPLMSMMRVDRHGVRPIDAIANDTNTYQATDKTGKDLSVFVAKYIRERLANGRDFPGIVGPTAEDHQKGADVHNMWAKELVHATKIEGNTFTQEEGHLGNHRLVWWIAVDEAKKKQVIRIFGLIKEEDFKKVERARVEHHLEIMTLEYLESCAKRWEADSQDAGKPRYQPMNFAEAYGRQENTYEVCEVTEPISLVKCFALSPGELKDFAETGVGYFPFVLSAKESEIVEHKDSSLVIGRSGTGKTSVAVLKFRDRALKYSDEFGADGKLTDRAFRGMMLTHCTRLKNDLRKHFLGLMSSGEELPTQNSLTSALKYGPLPLILTFHEFMAMMNYDLQDPEYSVRGGTPPHRWKPPKEDDDPMETDCVGWTQFKEKYAPKLKLKVSAQVFFKEIMTVIKGSVRSDYTGSGPLPIMTRQEYVEGQGRSSLSAVTEKSLREHIYEQFETYKRLMAQNNAYDIVDVTRYLLESFKGCRWQDKMYDTPKRLLHTVVVDEVQDLLPIQLMLLLKCTRSDAKNHGQIPTQFTFCGDTAQAVVKHSEFRFQTVKDLFHNHFVPKFSPYPPSDFQLTRNYRAASEILCLANSIIDLLQEFFPLRIDILEQEIAQASTNLRPVVVQMDMKVVINRLLGGGVDLGGVAGNDGSSVHFGAEQCVLVRTQQEVEKYKRIFQGSLVMTIEESKGLEFDDVLLVGFFASSSDKNEKTASGQSSWWTTLRSKKITDMDSYGSRLPDLIKRGKGFIESRHVDLLDLFRELYVGITRARRRIWIVDDTAICEPMFAYWHLRELVTWCSTEDELRQVKDFAKNSTPEQWLKKGHELLVAGYFEAAGQAFRHADAHGLQEFARGMGLYTNAINKGGTSNLSNKDKELLSREAAKVFESLLNDQEVLVLRESQAELDVAEKAARMYERAAGLSDINVERMEDLKRAGRLLLHNCHSKDYKKAAGLLETAKDYEGAMEAWKVHGSPHKAGRCCWLAGGKRIEALNDLSSMLQSLSSEHDEIKKVEDESKRNDKLNVFKHKKEELLLFVIDVLTTGTDDHIMRLAPSLPEEQMRLLEARARDGIGNLSNALATMKGEKHPLVLKAETMILKMQFAKAWNEYEKGNKLSESLRLRWSQYMAPILDADSGEYSFPLDETRNLSEKLAQFKNSAVIKENPEYMFLVEASDRWVSLHGKIKTASKKPLKEDAILSELQEMERVIEKRAPMRDLENERHGTAMLLKMLMTWTPFVRNCEHFGVIEHCMKLVFEVYLILSQDVKSWNGHSSLQQNSQVPLFFQGVALESILSTCYHQEMNSEGVLDESATHAQMVKNLSPVQVAQLSNFVVRFARLGKYSHTIVDGLMKETLELPPEPELPKKAKDVQRVEHAEAHAKWLAECKKLSNPEIPGKSWSNAVKALNATAFLEGVGSVLDTLTAAKPFFRKHLRSGGDYSNDLFTELCSDFFPIAKTDNQKMANLDRFVSFLHAVSMFIVNVHVERHFHKKERGQEWKLDSSAVADWGDEWSEEIEFLWNSFFLQHYSLIKNLQVMATPGVVDSVIPTNLAHLAAAMFQSKSFVRVGELILAGCQPAYFPTRPDLLCGGRAEWKPSEHQWRENITCNVAWKFFGDEFGKSLDNVIQMMTTTNGHSFVEMSSATSPCYAFSTYFHVMTDQGFCHMRGAIGTVVQSFATGYLSVGKNNFDIGFIHLCIAGLAQTYEEIYSTRSIDCSADAFCYLAERAVTWTMAAVQAYFGYLLLPRSYVTAHLSEHQDLFNLYFKQFESRDDERADQIWEQLTGKDGDLALLMEVLESVLSNAAEPVWPAKWLEARHIARLLTAWINLCSLIDSVDQFDCLKAAPLVLSDGKQCPVLKESVLAALIQSREAMPNALQTILYSSFATQKRPHDSDPSAIQAMLWEFGDELICYHWGEANDAGLPGDQDSHAIIENLLIGQSDKKGKAKKNNAPRKAYPKVNNEIRFGAATRLFGSSKSKNQVLGQSDVDLTFNGADKVSVPWGGVRSDLIWKFTFKFIRRHDLSAPGLSKPGADSTLGNLANPTLSPGPLQCRVPIRWMDDWEAEMVKSSPKFWRVCSGIEAAVMSCIATNHQKCLQTLHEEGNGKELLDSPLPVLNRLFVLLGLMWQDAKARTKLEEIFFRQRSNQSRANKAALKTKFVNVVTEWWRSHIETLDLNWKQEDGAETWSFGCIQSYWLLPHEMSSVRCLPGNPGQSVKPVFMIPKDLCVCDSEEDRSILKYDFYTGKGLSKSPASYAGDTLKKHSLEQNTVEMLKEECLRVCKERRTFLRGEVPEGQKTEPLGPTWEKQQEHFARVQMERERNDRSRFVVAREVLSKEYKGGNCAPAIKSWFNHAAPQRNYNPVRQVEPVTVSIRQRNQVAAKNGSGKKQQNAQEESAGGETVPALTKAQQRALNREKQKQRQEEEKRIQAELKAQKLAEEEKNRKEQQEQKRKAEELRKYREEEERKLKEEQEAQRKRKQEEQEKQKRLAEEKRKKDEEDRIQREKDEAERKKKEAADRVKLLEDQSNKLNEQQESITQQIEKTKEEREALQENFEEAKAKVKKNAIKKEIGKKDRLLRENEKKLEQVKKTLRETRKELGIGFTEEEEDAELLLRQKEQEEEAKKFRKHVTREFEEAYDQLVATHKKLEACLEDRKDCQISLQRLAQRLDIGDATFHMRILLGQISGKMLQFGNAIEKNKDLSEIEAHAIGCIRTNWVKATERDQEYVQELFQQMNNRFVRMQSMFRLDAQLRHLQDRVDENLRVAAEREAEEESFRQEALAMIKKEMKENERRQKAREAEAKKLADEAKRLAKEEAAHAKEDEIQRERSDASNDSEPKVSQAESKESMQPTSQRESSLNPEQTAKSAATEQTSKSFESLKSDPASMKSEAKAAADSANDKPPEEITEEEPLVDAVEDEPSAGSILSSGPAFDVRRIFGQLMQARLFRDSRVDDSDDDFQDAMENNMPEPVEDDLLEDLQPVDPKQKEWKKIMEKLTERAMDTEKESCASFNIKFDEFGLLFLTEAQDDTVLLKNFPIGRVVISTNRRGVPSCRWDGMKSDVKSIGKEVQYKHGFWHYHGHNINDPAPFCDLKRLEPLPPVILEELQDNVSLLPVQQYQEAIAGKWWTWLGDCGGATFVKFHLYLPDEHFNKFSDVFHSTRKEFEERANGEGAAKNNDSGKAKNKGAANEGRDRSAMLEKLQARLAEKGRKVRKLDKNVQLDENEQKHAQVLLKRGKKEEPRPTSVEREEMDKGMSIETALREMSCSSEPEPAARKKGRGEIKRAGGDDANVNKEPTPEDEEDEYEELIAPLRVQPKPEAQPAICVVGNTKKDKDDDGGLAGLLQKKKKPKKKKKQVDKEDDATDELQQPAPSPSPSPPPEQDTSSPTEKQMEAQPSQLESTHMTNTSAETGQVQNENDQEDKNDDTGFWEPREPTEDGGEWEEVLPKERKAKPKPQPKRKAVPGQLAPKNQWQATVAPAKVAPPIQKVSAAPQVPGIVEFPIAKFQTDDLGRKVKMIPNKIEAPENAQRHAFAPDERPAVVAAVPGIVEFPAAKFQTDDLGRKVRMIPNKIEAPANAQRHASSPDKRPAVAAAPKVPNQKFTPDDAQRDLYDW